MVGVTRSLHSSNGDTIGASDPCVCLAFDACEVCLHFLCEDSVCFFFYRKGRYAKFYDRPRE
jgi:hypothetical protein